MADQDEVQICIYSPNVKAKCGFFLVGISALYAVFSSLVLGCILKDFIFLVFFVIPPLLCMWSGIYMIYNKNKPSLILGENQVRLRFDCISGSVLTWLSMRKNQTSGYYILNYSDILGWHRHSRELHLKLTSGEYISFFTHVWESECELCRVVEILERKGIVELSRFR